MMRILLPHSIALVLLSLSVATAGAQQPPPPPEAKAAPAATPPAIPSDRLAVAKNIFLKRAGGSDIPYNVINSGFEGWGRYVLVDTADKADIVMEISAPSDDSGMRVSAKTSAETGQPERGFTSSKEMSSDPIRITVYDAKSKRPLWLATDKPKSAIKQRTRENNLVESASRLFSKFHDRVDPEPKPEKLP
jgi:hypothetical protein